MSEFQTKILKCVECHNEFAFTAGEQQYFTERGLRNEPKRCPPCRAARRGGERPAVRSTSRAKVWTIVRCADCGAETRVPFHPTQGRPVYCRACFDARKEQMA